MKFPQTEHLKKELNVLGKTVLLPLSYLAELFVNIAEKVFCKKEGK